MAPSYKQRSKDQLRHLQMIYQMPDVAVNPRQKVRDIIGRPLTFYYGLRGDAKRARVDALLDMIELDRPMATAARGAVRRRETAGVHRPRLGRRAGVDHLRRGHLGPRPIGRRGILKLLQELQNDLGVSYLFITHDLATVKAISDEIVVMYQGEIVEQGPRDAILTPPHHDYTDLLLSSVPEMRTDRLDGGPPSGGPPGRPRGRPP